MATSPANGQTLPSEEVIAPANDPFYLFKPLPVRQLRLNIGAERVIRANEVLKSDELWLGTAYDPANQNGDDISVYLRLADPLPVVAELICSVIGRALNLPIPEPFVVRAAPGELEGSKLLDQSKSTLLFASHDVGGQTFAQLMRTDSPSAQRLIASWKDFMPVTAFDEWLANRDRNQSNMLFIANAIWLIDHAEAFHGSAGELFGLDQLISTPAHNELGNALKDASAGIRKSSLAQACQWIETGAKRLRIEDVFTCIDLKPWRDQMQQAELLNFVKARLTVTYALLCQRLSVPLL